MKILYFHQHFKTPSQAGGTRSYEFAKRLVDAGHSVMMVCGKMADLGLKAASKPGIYRGMVDGIDVIQLDLPYSNKDNLLKRTKVFLQYAWKGIRLALSEEYDLLFATSTPLTAGIPGIAAKWFRGKKFVFEVRDLWPELPKALGMKNPFALVGMSILEWLSYHAADACVGLSPGICEGIRRRSQKGKAIALIPNGSDLDLFRPGNRADLDLPGIGRSQFVALFTGTHGIANGLDAVLDTAVELKKSGRDDIVLAFVGSGKLKAKLQARAQKEALGNCRFYDPIPKKDLSKIVSTVDTGMMILANIPAFYYGTSPNKFFDYIAAGLPVFCNYPGWMADMIRQHQCGTAVEPDNPKAFAEALAWLADHPAERRQMGSNARKLAETEFGRNGLGDSFVHFLENTLANRLQPDKQPQEGTV